MLVKAPPGANISVVEYSIRSISLKCAVIYYSRYASVIHSLCCGVVWVIASHQHCRVHHMNDALSGHMIENRASVWSSVLETTLHVECKHLWKQNGHNDLGRTVDFLRVKSIPTYFIIHDIRQLPWFSSWEASLYHIVNGRSLFCCSKW